MKLIASQYLCIDLDQTFYQFILPVYPWYCIDNNLKFYQNGRFYQIILKKKCSIPIKYPT